MDKTEAVAQAWASIDGKLDKFEAERDGKVNLGDEEFYGAYRGYMTEAEELIKRIEKRGYVIVPKKATYEMVCAGNFRLDEQWSDGEGYDVYEAMIVAAEGEKDEG